MALVPEMDMEMNEIIFFDVGIINYFDLHTFEKMALISKNAYVQYMINTLPMISKIKCDNIKPKSLLEIVIYCFHYKCALTKFILRLLGNTDIGIFDTFNKLNPLNVPLLLGILPPENEKAIQESMDLKPYNFQLRKIL